MAILKEQEAADRPTILPFIRRDEFKAGGRTLPLTCTADIIIIHPRGLTERALWILRDRRGRLGQDGDCRRLDVGESIGERGL